MLAWTNDLQSVFVLDKRNGSVEGNYYGSQLQLQLHLSTLGGAAGCWARVCIWLACMQATPSARTPADSAVPRRPWACFVLMQMEPPLCGPACPRHGKLSISQGVRVPCACTEAAPLSLPLSLPPSLLLAVSICIDCASARLQSRRQARPLRCARESQLHLDNQREGEREGETSEGARECEIRLQLSPNTACACGFTMFASLECTRLRRCWRCCCCCCSLGEHLEPARLGQWVQQTQLPVDSALVACISKSDKFEPSACCARATNTTGRRPSQARKEQEEGVAHPRLCSIHSAK